jgi:glucose/arabinose dehydrogenase
MRSWLVLSVVVAVGLVPGLSATAQTAQAPATITTVAGNGVDGHTGDGGPAASAAIDHPRGIAITPDGGFVFAVPFLPSVRRVGADGRITTVAGTAAAGFSGDGGPATAAQLNLVHGVALLPDGSMVLADTSNHRIRRVSPNGTITTVAGTGTFGYSGDGGPATAAQIAAPRGIATLPDGSILFPDSGNHRVRRISPSGVITTVAGNGTQGSSGDGGPALAAQLNLPFGVSPIPGNSGGFLIADAGNSRIRRVAADGTIITVASQLASPHAVAALTDGGFLVADTNANRVVRVSTTGTMTTVAGTGAAGFSGDGGPAAAAALNQPKALAVLPDLSGFLVGDSANNRVRLVRVDLRPPLALRVVVKQLRTTAGRPATLRYTLSEPAATRLEVVRRGTVVLRAKQQGKAGVNTLSFGRTLKAGAYGLRLRATAAGNRTASATASLVVRKRRS